MLSGTLTLNDGVADQTFVSTKILPDGIQRMNDESDLALPELLVIRHQVVGGGKASGGQMVDRHLVSLSRVERDSETSATSTCTVNLTMQVPRSFFTASEVEKQINMLVALLTSEGTLVQLLRGES